MNNFYGSPKHIYTFKKVKLVKILRLAGDDILKLDFGFSAVIKVRWSMSSYFSSYHSINFISHFQQTVHRKWRNKTNLIAVFFLFGSIIIFALDESLDRYVIGARSCPFPVMSWKQPAREIASFNLRLPHTNWNRNREADTSHQEESSLAQVFGFQFFS